MLQQKSKSSNTIKLHFSFMDNAVRHGKLAWSSLHMMTQTPGCSILDLLLPLSLQKRVGESGELHATFLRAAVESDV
jgi:hypothetical protein